MKIETDHYVTVTNAATLAGVSRFWMRQQAQAGKVKAVCIDGLWFVLKADAARFKLPTGNRR
jgi:hypothetical protein